MDSQIHILLVEDDESLGFLTKDNLEDEGWDVVLASDGEVGLNYFHQCKFDLVILDVMMPNRDGFDTARQIRKYDTQVPIMFLTARHLVKDRLEGFRLGGDDYLSKPFSIEELKCRIMALLRRTQDRHPKSNGTLIEIANCKLDYHNHVLWIEEICYTLTYKENKILSLFFKHPNQVIEREVFLKSIWEDEGFFVARSMDVFISKIRKMLQRSSRLSIENIRSVGYQLRVSA